MKRFYKSIGTLRQGDLFAVALDGKVMKTPGGKALTLQSPRLAHAVAGEWAAQTGEIDFETMPLTKLAYAALDAPPQRTQIAAHILRFGRSDLVCYRATEPELAAREAAVWDEPLAWARAHYRAELATGTGMRFIEQPHTALAALEAALAQRDDYAFAALTAATLILGSLVLALALADGKLDAKAAFAAAHVDESFQAEKWGRDAEADRRFTRLAFELEAAERFLRLL